MKTIIEDNKEYIECEFTHNSINKKIRYYKKDYGNDYSEITKKIDHEYSAWINWIEN